MKMLFLIRDLMKKGFIVDRDTLTKYKQSYYKIKETNCIAHNNARKVPRNRIERTQNMSRLYPDTISYRLTNKSIYEKFLKFIPMYNSMIYGKNSDNQLYFELRGDERITQFYIKDCTYYLNQRIVV